VTTDKLARHYPSLNPAERLSLLLAAAVRGDEAEHARLMSSAPRVSFRVPHTYGRAQAYLLTCLHSRLKRLNVAALFFKSSAMAAEARGKDEERMDAVARVFAYLVLVHARGWELFCERERLEPSVGTDPLPGETVLEAAEAQAEALSATAEELKEHARQHGQPLESLKTAESVADELREMYAMWVNHWE
jgi:hypothetical protein